VITETLQSSNERRNMERVLFADFVQAVKVFAGDYSIVNHAELEVRSPWDEPNPAGVYSLTQLPEGMTEDEFLGRMQPITDIVITCMDKDCAHSTWEQMGIEPMKLMMLTWGGGIVQHNLEGREGVVEAMGTIANYLAQLKREGKLPNLATIHADDHDSVCGAVKAFLGGTPLHEYLGQFLGREVTEHSPEEDEVMEWLVRHGAQGFVAAFSGTGVEVISRLHYTDRQNPDNNRLTQIELGVDLPEMDVAALKGLIAMRRSGE
jgi:hypothetical protein